jgi:hypothetical protein
VCCSEFCSDSNTGGPVANGPNISYTASYGQPSHVPPHGMVRGGSKAGGETALNELVCRDWRYDGGDGCKSSVIDRGCRLVLRDERRPHDVRDAAETGSSTSAECTARRDGARQRRKLELPLR